MAQQLDHLSATLTRLLEPVGRCLTPDVAKELVNLRADPVVQARIEELADKNTEGELSPEELDEYETTPPAQDKLIMLPLPVMDQVLTGGRKTSAYRKSKRTLPTPRRR